MEKIDLKKELPRLYKAKKGRMDVVEVPELSYLMVDGIDAREGSPLFTGGIQALFALSYTLKFLSKVELERDYTVMPLQALWWADDMEDFHTGNKERWRYTLLILQPEWITLPMLETAMAKLAKKKPELERVRSCRLEPYYEGKCLQTLHLGPFSEEGPVIEAMHREIRESGGTWDGVRTKHHEIYLSDFRRSAPEKWRTIIRQPFA